jgi:hypothetical protein
LFANGGASVADAECPSQLLCGAESLLPELAIGKPNLTQNSTVLEKSFRADRTKASASFIDMPDFPQLA